MSSNKVHPKVCQVQLLTALIRAQTLCPCPCLACGGRATPSGVTVRKAHPSTVQPAGIRGTTARTQVDQLALPCRRDTRLLVPTRRTRRMARAHDPTPLGRVAQRRCHQNRYRSATSRTLTANSLRPVSVCTTHSAVTAHERPAVHRANPHTWVSYQQLTATGGRDTG